ncbi:hypothetical protein OFC46_27745, partial [Escherichia coli]|nr:hypothetical protein [Escherichia coli]
MSVVPPAVEAKDNDLGDFGLPRAPFPTIFSVPLQFSVLDLLKTGFVELPLPPPGTAAAAGTVKEFVA